jgi:hypothetical protein
MEARAWFIRIAATASVIAVCLVMVFAYEEAGGTVWASGLGALVAATALANSILIFLLSEEKARVRNAFDLAEKWDKEPMLTARVTIRKNLGNLEALKPLVITDLEISAMTVHLVNFYWNMAAALELKLAHPDYLKMRFHESLKAYLPLIREWKLKTEDRSAPVALATIEKLHASWEK